MSLVDVIRSADHPSPHHVFHWQTGNRKNPSWAVREGAWKLLGNPQDPTRKQPITEADRLFLVDVNQDPGETRNIAAEHPEVVQRLRHLHDEWVRDVSQSDD
jgi:arylsulfatase A-like enzyme